MTEFIMQNGSLYEQDGEELKLIQRGISPLDALTLIRQLEATRNPRPEATPNISTGTHECEQPRRQPPSYSDRLASGFRMMSGGDI